MLQACLCPTYARYKFPACSDLTFRTDVLNDTLTLRLYNPAFGQFDVEKVTDSSGNLTLELSDLPAFVLNPWSGVWVVSFLYDGVLYEHFLSAEGEKTGLEIEAQRWMVAPASYTFYGFKIELTGEAVTHPPDEDSGLGFFALNSTFILS